MSGYYKPEDLEKFGDIGKEAPELWQKFLEYYGAATDAGALTKREKTLIGLAVGLPIIYTAVTHASDKRISLTPIRIVMMVSEGAFFAVLLIVFMGLLWRTFRREVELERQHRNFLSDITHELKSPIAAIRVALRRENVGVVHGEAKQPCHNHEHRCVECRFRLARHESVPSVNRAKSRVSGC